MDKKSNMKQAMYEMFGVGADQTAAKEEENTTENKRKAAPAATPVRVAEQAPAVDVPSPRSSAASTYIAPGTVFEGTIRSTGDIEIGGEFKGEITTEGTVVLLSNMQGNISAKSLKLSGCALVGDATVKEIVMVSKGASITGNVTAKEVQIAGQVTGDLKVADNTSLEGSAYVNGNIATSSIAVVRGAVICGGIQIQPTNTPDKRKN